MQFICRACSTHTMRRLRWARCSHARRHSDVRTLMDVLLGSPDGKDFNKDELKHNLMGDCPGAEMAAGCGLPGAHRPPRRPADSPLHMACYQGYGPEAVKLLLAAGADSARPNVQRLMPMAMTANQGNWREMQALLQVRPASRQPMQVGVCSFFE
ncbi:hypothetical protein COO60DRAFT_797861 [Scenedesmus sp. NREL 46B-D3]|nr:hypothetical protein COO60DRAFT_797861 [Scenedesmus sp. NREL 46B-D3]